MREKNNKGEVPITILVIGVFAICSLALFTFFVADFKMGNSFVGVSIMHKMDAAVDEYNFYKNSGIYSDIVDGFFPVLEVGQKKYLYFYKNKTSYFGLGKSNELAFSVRYPIK